ncbi:hypothetical protein SLS53_008638 [Cytospora paraplurivora]|uniref:Secreted protein n=1 Tax=Cytospora paraplurivora TaxID=2898453 RepID=A0AAN9TZZ4_9PEZI
MKTSLTTTIFLNVAALVAGAPAPTSGDPSHASSTTPDLEARGDTINGMHYCGIFANADSSDAAALVSSLGGDKKKDEYSIASHGCKRVACHNTSGVYVCNDNNHKITVSGASVANAAAYINKHCCYAPSASGRGGYPIRSGQQFTQWGWNVAVGYANCNDDVRLRPADARGWGVDPGTCAAQKGLTNANSNY